MRIRVVDGDVLQLRTYQDEGGIVYLDNDTENRLYEFLLARQMNRVTAPKEANLPTRLRP